MLLAVGDFSLRACSPGFSNWKHFFLVKNVQGSFIFLKPKPKRKSADTVTFESAMCISHGDEVALFITKAS